MFIFHFDDITGMVTVLRNSKMSNNSSFLLIYLVLFWLSIQILNVGSYNLTTELSTIPVFNNETTTTVPTLNTSGTTSLAFGNITTMPPNVTTLGNNITNTTNVSPTPFSGNLTTTSPYVATQSPNASSNGSTSPPSGNLTTTSPYITTQSPNATSNGSTSPPFGNLTTTSPYVATPSPNATSNGSTSSPFGNLTTTSPYVATPSPNATSNGSTSSPFGNLTTTIPLATTLQSQNVTNQTTTLTTTHLTTTLVTSFHTTTIFQTPWESYTTVDPSERIRNKIRNAADKSTEIVKVFNEIENEMSNVLFTDTNDESYSENLGNGISNLTDALNEKDLPENEWIDITKASIKLNSKLSSNMGDAKTALNNMIMKTSYKIIDKQLPNEKFYLKNNYADVAGMKSSPDDTEGFELQTNYGDVIVSPDMRESDSTLLLKMVSYKNDNNMKQTVANGVQMSTVFVSLVDTKDNLVPNNDPDKTYQVVLKSKEASAKPWHNIGGTSNGISALEISLTENALSLVELSSTDVKVWGKVNEAPTRYDYHFYYSAMTGDANTETIVKVDNIQIKKYQSTLRVLVQSSRPQDKLFMLVDHQGDERLKKRAAPVQLMTKTSTLKPFMKKDTNSKKWETFNIKDTSVDENYNVILKTNLFGTFTSVVSFITPVPLDFAKIFVDFDKKVLNNPYVLIVLLLIFLVYCILALMMRRLDKKDQIKWLYMPLADNNRSDPCQYLIRVQTGVRSSRIMSATPYFTLKGTNGETTIRILSDGVRKNLGSGTLSAYLLRTSKHLGPLLTLKIWHDNEGSSPRWFLSNIGIKDMTNSTWYSFPCHDWLSFDKGDGSIIRLLESHSNESDNFFTNIKNRIHFGLFEDHLYVSIMKRPRSSHFTRLQRLSTLVGVLYLSLISSAMYYKPNDKTPSRAFTLGPFTLSSKEIAVGIISSLIMVIPTSIIINLFRWRKVKGEKPDVCEESVSLFHRMKRFRLPWWSVYLAYFLIFLCIGTSAYFTFIYSILWGKELALQWLLSVVVNVTGSVILIQPVKIITLAMLTSCIIRSPQDDYADSNTDLSEGDTPRGEVKICPPPNMFTKTWKNKKRKMELNDKLFKIFQTFSFKIVFVMVCLIFLMNETINKRFIQNDAIKRELQIGNLKQANGTYAIWEWILKYAVPIIFPYKRYNGQVLTINNQRFLADETNLRLGAVRFRQIRTDGVWRENTRKKSNLILPAFRYTSSAESGEIFEQIGSIIDYENGGYIIDINNRYKMANRILLELRSFDWLDEKTRCLFICFNTYNANSGLYMQTIIQLEKPFLKEVIPVFKVTSFKFYPFVDLWDYFMLLMVVILACIAIANVANLVLYVWKTRTLLSWSMLILLLNIVSLLLIIVSYILRIDCLLVIRDKLISHPEKYISGDSLIIQDRIYRSGLCGLILVTSLGLCQPLSINYYFFLMKASIVISLPYLRSFVIFLMVIISSFSSATYVLLSASLFSFRTLGSAYLTLFRIFLLLAKFKQTFKKDTSSFHFIFFAYTFFSAIILMNICISILNDSFEYIKKVQHQISSDYMFDWELNQHFWDQLINFFRSTSKVKPTEKVPVKANEGSKNCLDNLSKQLDKIFDVIIFHNETEKKTLKLKCLALYYMRCQYKSASSKYAVDETKIELETADTFTNMLRVKKERNGNNRWTYWYYNDENKPLLTISFFCDEEDPGEIICRDILEESDILSKIQHGLISYTLLGPTIEIVSRNLKKIKKNSFEIVYFCLKPLHHYYCCRLIRSVDGQTWLLNEPQKMTKPGVEEHILQDVIHVEKLPSYLTLVRHHRREYLCWNNKNGEMSSLLEPSLSLCLSSRDISKKTCTAILKMELEDHIFYPIIMLTLHAKIEDPMIFRFQHRNTNENSSLQLYSQTNAKEWNEESQIVKDKISFRAKPQANQETSYMLRPSQIKWDWRDQMKSMEDPLNEELFHELSQKIGNNWKELGKNLGIPPRAIHRIKHNTSVVHPEMACFEVLTQWHRFSVMTASKIQLLKSALSVIEEDLTHTVDDIAEKYENQYTKVIQESLKTKFFDQISRSEVMLSAWQELAIRLGLNKKEIENLDKCNTLTAREKCYNALMSWQNYNKETLRQQLAEMGFTFLADKISTDEEKK